MSQFSDSSLLMPPRLGSDVVTTGNVRIPFRPAFLFDEDSAEFASREGKNFPYYSPFYFPQRPFRQYVSTGGASPTPICGNKYYMVETVVNSFNNGTTSWSGTRIRTLTLNFDTVANAIYLTTTTQETGNKPSGLSWLYPAENLTATGGTQTTASGFSTYTVTLSDEVDVTMVDGWVATWLAQSDAFKASTGGGYESSFRNEKTDGGDYVVRALEFLLRGGVSGYFPNFDYSDYQVQLAIRTRRNKMDVEYPNGTELYLLEDEVTDKARDTYGVWDWDGSGTWTSVEAQAGLNLITNKARGINDVAGYSGLLLPQGEISEATFVTNTGNRYWVWLSVGYVEYDEFGFEPIDWVEEAAHNFVLDGDGTAYTWLNNLTHTASSFSETDIEAIYEEQIVDGAPEWVLVFRGGLVTIGDEDEGDYADVTPISGKPADSPLILIATRQRDVSRFGYYGLTDLTTRFRKYTYTNLRTTYIAGSAGSDVCGSTYPTGSFEEGWTQEYIDGYEQERIQTHNLRNAGGVDFTPEKVSFRPVGGWALINATSNTEAQEVVSGETINGGNFDFALDREDANGAVLSESTVNLALDSNFRTPKQTFQPPAAGTAKFAEGQRLTYTAPP